MIYTLSALAIISTLVIGCGDMKKGNGQDGNNTNQFTTTTEAATEAKQNMLEAAEKVEFGINKEKLRASSPGMPIASYDVIWGALLKADSNTSPEGIIGLEKATIVPLVNGNEVVTVVFLENKNLRYSITALGEKQISSELDIISKTDVAITQAKIKIYDVPNLQATIYAVTKNNTTTYYTSYNNNSIRQAMDAKTLIQLLVSDAIDFQKKFGEDLKKGSLVR